MLLAIFYMRLGQHFSPLYGFFIYYKLVYIEFFLKKYNL